jgi:hypothetical protein
LGDDTIAALNVDGENFAEADYGILVSMNNKYQELDQAMRELAHAGIQNDKMDFSTLMSIYTSDSISDIRRKIEGKENEKLERESQAGDAERESRTQEIALKAETEQAKEAGEESRNIRDNETMLTIAMLKLQAESAVQDVEVNDDGIAFDVQKHKDDIMIKMKNLQQQMTMHNDKMDKEEKKIAVSRISKNKTNN